MDGRNTAPSVQELVADAARRLGEHDEEGAVAALTAAAAREPDDPSLHFVTALVAWSLRDTAKALTVAKSCFERQPGNGTAAELVASLAAQAGDLVESLFYGKLATALPPDDTMRSWLPPGFPMFDEAFLSIQDKPLLSQSRLLAAAGKLTVALDRARQHVEVAPDDAEGRTFYAGLLLRSGQAALAVEAIGPVVQSGDAAPAAASLLAQSLATVGESTAAAHWHERACLGDPDDAEIAGRRIADAPWIGAERRQRDAWVKDWLDRFTRPGKPRHWRPAGDRLVIGYLVSHFGDRGDAAAVAAVARAHARPGASVVGYGLGAQSWDENGVLGGAFDKWRDITGVDPATLAKMIAGDGVDVVIDVGGFAAPGTLRALARVNTAVRVAWIADAAGLERRVYDAVVAPRSAPSAAEAEIWRVPCGAYPLRRDWNRRLERGADAVCRFGADVGLAQIDPHTAQLWRKALEAAPEAMLLLRAHDMAPGANLARLIDRFGRALAARVDIVAAADADDFYRQVDIALAPARGLSARMAGEALACGVPVIAIDDGGPWRPYPLLLRELGLAAFVATTERGYVDLAAGLAASAQKRAEAAGAVAPVAAGGQSGAAAIAAAIEQAARATLGKAAA